MNDNQGRVTRAAANRTKSIDTDLTESSQSKRRGSFHKDKKLETVAKGKGNKSETQKLGDSTTPKHNLAKATNIGTNIKVKGRTTSTSSDIESTETEIRKKQIEEERAEENRKLKEIQEAEAKHRRDQADRKAKQEEGNKNQLDTSIQKEKLTKLKMNQRDIQNQISLVVPEFNGRDTTQRDSDLTRFLATADSVYGMLASEEEKKIFDTLIKFRLTGDAYMRIAHRDIKNYKTLKTVLESMYTKSQTLEELERLYMNIQQSYGETCRNYGYRLMEALDRYKEGYKTKYNLNEIDATYVKHLGRSAVQIYKKGINNIILRDKIATSKAENVEEIVTESEATEKMLEATAGTISQPYVAQQTSKHIQRPQQYAQPERVVCNYCNKANHTWNDCRTRLFRENATQRQAPYVRNTYQPNEQFQSYQRYQFNNEQNQTRDRFHPQQNSYRYNGPNRYTPQRYPSPQMQQEQRIPYQPKYCSFCKTTKGHTFQECRSKLLNNNGNTNNYNQPPNTQRSNGYMPSNTNNQIGKAQPPETNNLEERFGNMRIGQISQHQQQYSTDQNQGNTGGSSQ